MLSIIAPAYSVSNQIVQFKKSVGKNLSLFFSPIFTSGLYYKHIMIVNDDSRVTLQTEASLTSVIDDTS